MKLACSFIYQKFGNEKLYTCWVDIASIKDRGVEIDEIIGKHKKNQSNMMVKAVWFTDKIINYFPRKLHNIFPELVAVGIVGCDLKEISREDLEGLENLQFIYIHANKLTLLPDDLFKGMTKLKEISIIDNKELMGITSKLFKPVINNGLKYVDLVNNGSVSAFYCPGYKGSVSSVNALMKIIDGTNCTENKNIAGESSAEQTVVEQESSGFNTTEASGNENILSESSSKLNEAKVTESDCEKSSSNIIIIDDSESLGEIEDNRADLEVDKSAENFTIIIGSKSYQVNKEVLATQSKMISSLIQREPQKTTLEIKGFAIEAVEHLLHYINTGEILDNVKPMKLYEIAATFKVLDLEVECEEKVLEQLDSSNADKVLSLGLFYRSFTMKREALNFVSRMFPKNRLNVDLMDDEAVAKVIEAVRYQRKKPKRDRK